jgi:predicted transcriptional regulator
MVALKISVDERTAVSLEELAARLDRPMSELAGDAIAQYVAIQSAHLAEIEAGLADADAGRFATDAEVATVVDKYVRQPG